MLMKRDQRLPFVLGFVAGMLFTLLAGGAVGGWFGYQKYQEAVQQRDAEIKRAEELAQQLESVKEQAAEARQEAEFARLDAELLRMKR
jgi:hypothetical protein